ncbi:maleylpyruvate isomerase family mycothiol-dependent enzyme [Asanoa sp. WMMD1127]|uniref:maleylpyruvate isomerase family mycothiol-dependent enzyme n=1 Tax=Asanoa sp. WMMD1127 TaxID=3016107 RepID=UPI002415EA2E|nr:maleylpyruvate isomerase family mycothiol-dependent enzyme [Asanoa sp. WMMD1127]MDG4826895.1 maleylpyruvate isomerase family mycothiol-dependent enzyme [Asanoa sp. WMMD1127]
MASSADRVIAVLRAGHDDLAAKVAGFSPDDLARPSGCADWDVSQVLSHLGSGAEINLATLEAGITGGAAPDDEFNKGVWAKWDNASREERAAWVVTANDNLVKRYESLDDQQREAVRVPFAWMPAPVDVAAAGIMRLSEFALHAWDVDVAFDPAATVDAAAAPLLLAQTAYMFGWIAKPERLDGRTATLAVELTDQPESFGLALGPEIALTEVPVSPDGTLRLPAEAWLRLVTGRLKPEHTTPPVKIDGPLTLDDLRRVFPGF